MPPSPATRPEPGHWCRPLRREGSFGLKLGLLSRTPRLPCSATAFNYILLHSSWRAGVRGSSHPRPFSETLLLSLQATRVLSRDPLVVWSELLPQGAFLEWPHAFCFSREH